MKTPQDIKDMKGKEKIAMLTCYDATMGEIMQEHVDLILVGDSYGMVVLGHENTTFVTMEDMERATSAVARGAKNALIVGDLPLGTYDWEEDALVNAKRLLTAGAHAIKIERKPEIAAFLVKQGISVMGHIGLTPQTITDFKVQGKTDEDSQRLLEEAKLMEEAGCFSLVLECIPKGLAERITKGISIPTIGIGAGIHCDGQVLVSYDMLGLFQKFKPRFVRRFADVSEEMKKGFAAYQDEVKSGSFPTDAESFK